MSTGASRAWKGSSGRVGTNKPRRRRPCYPTIVVSRFGWIAPAITHAAYISCTSKALQSLQQTTPKHTHRWTHAADVRHFRNNAGKVNPIWPNLSKETSPTPLRNKLHPPRPKRRVRIQIHQKIWKGNYVITQYLYLPKLMIIITVLRLIIR